MSRTTRSSARRVAVTSSSSSSSSPALAIVPPRKRAIVVPTPPVVKRFKTAGRGATKRASESVWVASSSDSEDERPAAAKVKRTDDALYYWNLDAISYYELLNVGRNATKADITSKVNNLQLMYKKPRDDDTAAENTNEKIHSTLGNALQVLSVVSNRKVYDQYIDEKDKLDDYFNNHIAPLRKTANEMYSSLLRIENDARDFYEMDIAQILKHNVYKIIESNIKNIHYKTTITNRLLVEWSLAGELDSYNNAGIDEEYLNKYFKDDGVVAIVLCSNRPGCAVIELLTQKTIMSIIERESKRKRFSVRDYTEAEFGIDHTNYSPQLDKLNVIQNDIDELDQKLFQNMQFVKDIIIDDNSALEDAERQINFIDAFVKAESGGEELEDEDDEDDDDDYYEE